MAYIPYNAIFFERMIASFRVRGNVGFVMYIADAMGYLGSVIMLLVKELVGAEMNWSDFFREGGLVVGLFGSGCRSEEHTSELQSLMRISYAVFCLKKKLKIITYRLKNSKTI